MNEDLYKQNLDLESTIEELSMQKEMLDKEVKYLRDKNNEFDKSRKDSALEQQLVTRELIKAVLNTKREELLRVEHHYNKNMEESENINSFLTKAIELVKTSGDKIQSEFKELDDLREMKHSLSMEKFKIDQQLYKLEEEVKKGHTMPEPYGWEKAKDAEDNVNATRSVDQELEFKRANHAWEDEVDGLDHHDVRILNKIRRLENVVENTNLILEYVENNGVIKLKELDKFIIDNRPDMDNKSTMKDIDNLCLSCRSS